ncbi:MAG: hypothetical protein EBR82_26480 [Caulobacteraceae bacterium]|nr:hypothetical protein [Caulobacteraceae bacterium]
MQNVQYLPKTSEMTVNYTGFTTDNSTAVTADLSVGDCVIAYGADTDGTLRVCRPATGTNHLAYPKFIVAAMPASVNDRISSGSTTRKGGLIKAIPVGLGSGTVGVIQAKCAASQTAGVCVGVVNGSFELTTVADAAVDTAAKLGTRVGIQLTTTTTAAVVNVMVGGL